MCRNTVWRAIGPLAIFLFTIFLFVGSQSPARADGGADGFDAQAMLFQYDDHADLGLRELGTQEKEQARVRDVTFNVPGVKEPVRAYLVVPRTAGPFAGVLWVHWLGTPETTNREEFLAEAIALAPRGFVSLLVDAMWSAPNWYSHRVPEEDFANSIRQVVALRRAMDLLESQPNVDRERLGYVGHDYGALYGMLLGGVDHRARTRIYVAAPASLSEWAFFAHQPRSKVEYLRQNAPLEATDYLRHAGDVSTLFQFGARDPYVSHSGTFTLLAATPAPKERRFYEADHTVDAPEALRDRAEWLQHQLGAQPPAAQ